MNFLPSETQVALCEEIRRFGKSISAGLSSQDFERGLFQKCGEMGIQGIAVPETYGGSGYDLTTTILAMETLGKYCRNNGLVFSLNAQICAVQIPILQFGSKEQKQKYLPQLCSGKLVGAHAISEPDSGSDVMSMSARATREQDSYVLEGTKTFVTNAPVADILLVFASLKQAGLAGVTGFLVERETPGLLLSSPIPKMGLHGAPMGEVVLDKCRIPLSARLGAEGAGSMVFGAAMEWERACIFASHLGAMERLLEQTIEYATTRKQFGQPLSKFSPIADSIVQMKIDIEASRMLLYRVAFEKDRGENAALWAAIAKLFVSEAHVRQTLAALQIHGAYGYATEFGVERELRDSLAGTIYSGTSEMQKKIIARLMEL
jgi:hypothetical protein